MNQTMSILNDTECDTLLSALREPLTYLKHDTRPARNHLIALLMMDAGLRVGETVSLRVGDLFVLGEPVGMIRVVTEKRKRIRPNSDPTIVSQITRDIPVTVRLDEAIKEYATREWTPCHYQPTFYAFRGKSPVGLLTPRQVERFIRKAAIESLRRPVHPHILRHTFATRLMTKCSIRVVQQLLGHASIQSTQVYTHPNSEDLQKAIDTLNGTGAQNSG